MPLPDLASADKKARGRVLLIGGSAQSLAPCCWRGKAHCKPAPVAFASQPVRAVLR